VRGDEDRLALRGQLGQHPAHPPDALDVEAVDRLVQDHGGRVAEQRGGDAEPLRHAEGELPAGRPATERSPTASMTSSTGTGGCRWSGRARAGGGRRCGTGVVFAFFCFFSFFFLCLCTARAGWGVVG
jgi:hypothetical protein